MNDKHCQDTIENHNSHLVALKSGHTIPFWIFGDDNIQHLFDEMDCSEPFIALVQRRPNRAGAEHYDMEEHILVAKSHIVSILPIQFK
jgi:hypothetical protein